MPIQSLFYVPSLLDELDLGPVLRISRGVVSFLKALNGVGELRLPLLSQFREDLLPFYYSLRPRSMCILSHIRCEEDDFLYDHLRFGHPLVDARSEEANLAA